jgi:hypothetical protein
MDVLTNHRRLALWCAIVAASSVTACVPELGDGTAIVSAPRILAVRSEPAEAAPGRPVTYTALYASADGTLTEAPLDWGHCILRKPLSELGPVNRGCFVATDEEALVSLGEGLSVMGDLPRDGCRLFGPNPPVPRDGEPAGRPVDPDPTGGFYQPVRIRNIGEDTDASPYTLFEQRIVCTPAGTTQEQAADLTRRYRVNANPVLEPVLLAAGGTTVEVPSDGEGTPPTVARGAQVRLNVAWPECPSVGVCGDGVCSADEDRTQCLSDCRTPLGCGGAETYVAFDPASRAVVSRRETMRVTWFATAGSFGEERTGRTSEDLGRESQNAWTAPLAAGDVVVWVVLRDDRGGTSWRTVRVRVE